MELRFGITFHDLYERAGLIKLDRAFLAQLAQADRSLDERLAAAHDTEDVGAVVEWLLERGVTGARADLGETIAHPKSQ